MNLFGIGPTEIIVVVIVILVLFGPDKLPEIAKKIGGASREIREGLDTINEQMNTALEASMEMEKAQMIKPASEAPASADTQATASVSQVPAPGDTQAGASESETSAPADNPVIMPPSDHPGTASDSPQGTPADSTRPPETNPSLP
jgi:TatA/E family protein of Tat protein translocase